MNDGLLDGFGATPVTGYPTQTGGAFMLGNRGRVSIDEIRAMGYPDNNNNYAGAGRIINTNPQVHASNPFFPGDFNSVVNVGAGTFIISGTTQPWSAAYNTAGAIYHATNSTANYSAFESNTIVGNLAGRSVTLGAMSTAVGGMLYVANGGTVSMGVNPAIDFISGLAFDGVNSATFSVPAAYSYQAKNTVVGPGVTITKRVGYRYEDSTTSGGTVTTQVGLDIPALSAATTNIGIQNLASLNQQGAVNAVNNAVTIVSNAATVPINQYLTTVTNSGTPGTSPNITLTTTGATDGQLKIVRWYDSTATPQTLAWTNTEISTVSPPTTTNGSTTSPLTVGFMYNTQTSKWRCIASA